MSTPSDVAKADAFLRFGTRIFNFRLPNCKPSVDFLASFKSSIAAPEAASFINTMNQNRQDMLSLLYSAPGTYDVKIRAIDVYLHSVFKLYDASQSQKLQLDKDLAFEWRGAITERTECIKSSDILFEIMFLLHTKAIMLNIAAKHLLDTDPVAFLSDAAKYLLEASSIMKYMGDNVANGVWSRTFSKRAPNPPEVSAHACFGLAAMFKGQAQGLSFMKAATGGSAPATIRSRLAVGVINSMTICLEQLCTLPDAAAYHADLIGHAHVTRQFFTVLAYQHSAQAYLEKTEVGNAIAFCQTARAHMAEQKSSSKPVWTQPGLPKHVGQYADLGSVVAHITDTLNQIQNDAERDNKFVYFQPVPGPYSSNSSAGLPLPGLPAEASVMNPTAYQEPNRSAEAPIVLEYKARPSIFSSMLSGLVGGSSAATPAAAPAAAGDTAASAPPAPAGTPGPGASDEEVARSLQRQYDAEAARGPAQAPAPGPAAPPPAPRYNSLV